MLGSCDEVCRDSLRSLLQESSLWLAIVRCDPPPDWTEQTLDRHEVQLAELRDVFADRAVGPHTCSAAEAWLTGYCAVMRRRHRGATASTVLRRLRGDTP